MLVWLRTQPLVVRELYGLFYIHAAAEAEGFSSHGLLCVSLRAQSTLFLRVDSSVDQNPLY